MQMAIPQPVRLSGQIFEQSKKMQHLISRQMSKAHLVSSSFLGVHSTTTSPRVMRSTLNLSSHPQRARQTFQKRRRSCATLSPDSNKNHPTQLWCNVTNYVVTEVAFLVGFSPPSSSSKLPRSSTSSPSWFSSWRVSVERGTMFSSGTGSTKHQTYSFTIRAPVLAQTGSTVTGTQVSRLG